MIQIVDKKRFFVVMMVAILIIAGIIWGILKLKNKNQETQVFEALVMPVDQKNSDPVEDARSSLKKGDVISIFPEGHNWSNTEKISYLIVKIKLTPEDAAKLVQPKTQNKKVEPSAGQGSTLDKKVEPQQETVLARQYRLKLPDLDLQKFFEDQKQPFEGKVFDSGMIQKK